MELFTQLFGDLLAFVYHCFDRIVIYGYLSGLSRPEQVVHFFRQVVGVPVVSKEVLSQRTADYQAWVEAFARNHRLPIEWAEKGVRKEDHVVPWQRRMARKRVYGVYYIFKSMEQGPTFRVSVPKYPTKDPHHRILAPQRSRFTHYDFYIRDETLGPMVMRVASFFPFQTTYYLNGHSFIEQELNRARIGFRKTHKLPLSRSTDHRGRTGRQCPARRLADAGQRQHRRPDRTRVPQHRGSAARGRRVARRRRLLPRAPERSRAVRRVQRQLCKAVPRPGKAGSHYGGRQPGGRNAGGSDSSRPQARRHAQRRRPGGQVREACPVPPCRA